MTIENNFFDIFKGFVHKLNEHLNPSPVQIEEEKPEIGFVAMPEDKNKLQYLYPNFPRIEAGERPFWTFPGLDIKHPILPPSDALRGKLKFINLKETHRGNQDQVKCEFWFDCGNMTVVFEVGYEDARGKINNASKSFLNSLSSLTDEELKEPITISLHRLVDTPGFTYRDGSVGTDKVIFVDVWKASGEKVYATEISEGLDGNVGANIITRINYALIGKAITSPRSKEQQQPQTQALQLAPEKQTATLDYKKPSTYPTEGKRKVLMDEMDEYVIQVLGGNMEPVKELLTQMFPGKKARPQLDDVELFQFFNGIKERFPINTPTLAEESGIDEDFDYPDGDDEEPGF